MSEPVTTLVTYRPKPGKFDELQALVRKHAPALKSTGLITAQPVQVWEASDKETGEQYFVELFQWKDEAASSIAHQTPEVMAVWEPMGNVLDSLSLAKLTPVDAAG